MTQNNVTTTYTYDANNRLLKETVAGIATTYAYDANGNMISALKGGNAAGAYAYNLFGNQTSFTTNDSLYTYYTYRPDGLRHSIGDTVHIWDGANIVADVDGNDVSVYIRGINLIYADDGDKTYYHFNAHGDVVALTNESGNKTKSYSYNAFGVEHNEATLDDNPFRYCGEYYDKETQTIYLRARYYNAEQGRFTQEDPIRDGYNWYAYCGGNPIMFVDPTGHAEKTINKHSFNDGGVGGGGAILLPVTQVIEKIVEVADDAGAAIGNFVTNAWSVAVNFCATQVDNIAYLLEEGIQAFQNKLDQLAQDFNNNTTNPPDPNNWQPGDRFKATVEQLTPGEYQKHHVLSKDIMTALENSNAKGAFKRNDFIVSGLEEMSHKGYQDWHREYVKNMVDWIDKRKDFLTPQQFIDHLNEIYSHQDMIDRFGIVIFTYGG